jgi:hypothetical protein
VKKFLNWGKISITLLFSSFWISYGIETLSQNRLIDFSAFYGAAKNILNGLSPYNIYYTFYGSSSFQSPLWVGWFFIPFTLFPIDRAFILFGVLNLLIILICLIIVITWQSSRISPLFFIYLLCDTLVLSYDTIRFGQVTIIQLVAVILMIFALQVERPFIAGLLLPLVIIKPHLVIFFLYAAFRRGGRRMLLASLGSILLLILTAVSVQPTWITEMFRLIVYGQQNSSMEWNKFVTITGLFSLPPWLGLLVLLLFLPFFFWLDYQFKSVETKIWLPIALVLSLAITPYAFSYDLPLLLPALVWLCVPWSGRSIILLLFVSLIVIKFSFSGISYIAVLLVALFSIQKVIRRNQLHVEETIAPYIN